MKVGKYLFIWFSEGNGGVSVVANRVLRGNYRELTIRGGGS